MNSAKSLIQKDRRATSDVIQKIESGGRTCHRRTCSIERSVETGEKVSVVHSVYNCAGPMLEPCGVVTSDLHTLS